LTRNVRDVIVTDMAENDHQNPLVVGLTGSFGSGCGYLCENILKARGFGIVSLGSILQDEYRKTTNKDPNKATRTEKQAFGDEMRQKHGSDFFARQAMELVRARKADHAQWAIKSIRNPAEVGCFRTASQRFFLLGVAADRETRWKRVRRDYKDNLAAFEDDDIRDTGRDSPLHGQRVGDCFAEADIVLDNRKNFQAVGNEEFREFAGLVNGYIGLVEHPLSRQEPLSRREHLMSMAYAASQESHCLKRKVGAVIVDRFGNVISSGFNEVPRQSRPCKSQHGKCYRDVAWELFWPKLTEMLPEATTKQADLKRLFRRNFKILDYCQSLHAEENAIVNLARNGRSVPLDECVLYTTTYPCRMCANKIVNLGIKLVVFLEPYPDEESYIILDTAGVKQEMFQGVTFKSYFRLYGEQR